MFMAFSVLSGGQIDADPLENSRQARANLSHSSRVLCSCARSVCSLHYGNISGQQRGVHSWHGWGYSRGCTGDYCESGQHSGLPKNQAHI